MLGIKDRLHGVEAGREQAQQARLADPNGLSRFQSRYAVESRLAWTNDGFVVLPALHSRSAPRHFHSAHSACVLEAVAAFEDTVVAFESYLRGQAAAMDVLRVLPAKQWQDECLELSTGRVGFARGAELHELTAECRAGGSVTLGILQRAQRPLIAPSLSAFVRGLDELVEMGLLCPPRGQVSMGHLSRREPFCPRYGRSRGTIIDRHYLGQFVASIEHLVRGKTVEVGTSMLTPDNELPHGFRNATEYRTIDCIPGPNVDICGDVSNPELLPAGSVDSILCFNVLEHCADMQSVVDNMHRWLAPGGRVFCMVPNVQRVHEAPKDFWRPMPAGVECLFRAFRERALSVYGNLQTTLAALMALAVEDLEPGALNEQHPDYPVATCIVATK